MYYPPIKDEKYSFPYFFSKKSLPIETDFVATKEFSMGKCCYKLLWATISIVKNLEIVVYYVDTKM